MTNKKKRKMRDYIIFKKKIDKWFQSRPLYEDSYHQNYSNFEINPCPRNIRFSIHQTNDRLGYTLYIYLDLSLEVDEEIKIDRLLT